MALVAGYSLNNSATEFGGRTALALALTGCSVDANGIDFSTSTTNFASILAADNTPLRLTAPFTIHIDFTTGSTTTNQGILDFCSATGFAGYNIFTNSSGILEFMYGAGAANTNSDNRRSWTYPSALATNTRYRFSVAVTDTSGSGSGVSMWINGAAISGPGISGTGGAISYGANDFVLGNRTPYGTARNGSQRLHKLAIVDFAGTLTDHQSFVSNADSATSAWYSTLAISNHSTTVRRLGTGSVALTGYATTPTTGNTTVRLGGVSGPILPLDSVNVVSGTATVNFTVPNNYTLQNGTSLFYYVTVDGVSVQSASNVSLLPPTTRGYINLTSITTTGNSLATDYAAFTPVVGDQIEYDLTTTGNTLTLSVANTSVATYTGAITQNSAFNYRVIRANGTVGAEDSFTFVYVAGAIVISSINAGNPIRRGEGDIPVVISGVNSNTVTGVTLNGVAQGFASITPTILYLNQNAWPNCMYGQSINLVVTTASSSDSEATSIIPSGSNGYITADGTYNASADGTITGTTPVLAGDQLEYETPSSNLVGFTIGGNWIPTFVAGNPGYIRMRILDASDFTFGNWVNYPFTAFSDSGLVENPANPLPASITLSGAGSTYDLSQHIVNSTGSSLIWSVYVSGSALPAGVILNSSTGVLSFNGTGNQSVTGVYFNVEPV